MISLILIKVQKMYFVVKISSRNCMKLSGFLLFQSKNTSISMSRKQGSSPIAPLYRIMMFN